VPSTLATRDSIAAGSRRIEQVDSRGCTDLSGGWLTGCREIADHLDGEQLARCLLLTDGLANRGIVDHDELARHATELRARGIVTSTFGIGRD
jgi:Ca-activated chloride channel family protein